MSNARRRFLLRILSTSLLLVSISIAAAAGPEATRFVAQLDGLAHVPPVLTGGSGRVTLDLAPAVGFADYTLSLKGLAASPIAVAIHIGQEAVNGAGVIYLCLTPTYIPPASPPGGRDFPFPVIPLCPAGTEGVVKGTLAAERVFHAQAQGLDSGDVEGFTELLAAGVAYVEVSTNRFQKGEIRGQLRRASRDDESDDAP